MSGHIEVDVFWLPLSPQPIHSAELIAPIPRLATTSGSESIWNQEHAKDKAGGREVFGGSQESAA
eukprot:15458539-Alexandrium_andersonii.AAC.1